MQNQNEKQKVAQVHPPIQWHSIGVTALFSILLLLAFVLYINYATDQQLSLFRLTNLATAETALALVGLSFALSGIGFFWDIFDRQVRYRKYLGLFGFAIAAVHVLLSLQIARNIYAFSFGLLGILLLVFMAAISTHDAQLRFGQRWRQALRVGYLAYIAIIAHYAILRLHAWTDWFAQDKISLPPVSLITVILAIGVIVLRLAMQIEIRRRAEKQVVQK